MSMKILVLCVDRDDDIGVKTGIKAPLVGREDNLAAAIKLGLADPEDSDVNALLSAVSTYDNLVKEGQDAEIATICGDVRVGATSDLVLTQQLDQVLEEVRPDRVFLVSDGAEDEAFAPIVGSRIRVDHVRRVYVRQTPTAESLYYALGRQLKNPKVRRKIVAPLGFVLLLFGADSAGRTLEPSYVVKFLTFSLNSVWFFVLGTLLFEGGKVLSAYLQHGRAPRHALAVAVTFIALGLIVLATIQILQLFFAPYNPSSALPLIYLSIGLAIFLVAVTGLSYRTREQRPAEPMEDGWRH